MKQRFEHKVVYCFKGNESDELKKIEKDGWELITVLQDIMGLNYKMFFKKPVELEQEDNIL